MAFVRAKKIKGKEYGYLVQNLWKKGKVKQVTKKYLGKIIVCEGEDGHIEANPSLSKKEFILELLVHYFALFGFEKHPRKLAVVKDDITIHFPSKKIMQNDKAVVLKLNERYVYSGLLSRLLDFYEPEGEDERPGTRLAQACSDIGLTIHPQSFITLYKKIYT